MPETNEITVCRHAAQKILHWAVTSAPQSCQGLLAGHGCRIDDARLLDPNAGADAAAVRAAIDSLTAQGLGVIGWFHSRPDGHEPDMAAMSALERIAMPEPRPAVPVHLLVAMDMKGRLDMQAYLPGHAEIPDRAPLRLVDDTPLYLHAPRR